MTGDKSPDLDALLQRIHEDRGAGLGEAALNIDLSRVDEAVKSALGDNGTPSQNRPTAPNTAPHLEQRNQQLAKGKTAHVRRPDNRAAKG